MRAYPGYALPETRVPDVDIGLCWYFIRVEQEWCTTSSISACAYLRLPKYNLRCASNRGPFCESPYYLQVGPPLALSSKPDTCEAAYLNSQVPSSICCLTAEQRGRCNVKVGGGLNTYLG